VRNNARILDSDRLDHPLFILPCELSMRSFSEVPQEPSRVILGAGPLAVALGFYQVAIAVFLPLEGVSITDVGVILTSFGLAAVVFSIPFSILSDRYGRKLLMFLGAFISAPVTIVPGMTSDFLILEISALVGGVSEAMFISTWNAYLADSTPASARPATFSLLRDLHYRVRRGQLPSSSLPIFAFQLLGSSQDRLRRTRPLGVADAAYSLALGDRHQTNSIPSWNLDPKVLGDSSKVLYCQSHGCARRRARYPPHTNMVLS
jgi:hypothetical protein